MNKLYISLSLALACSLSATAQSKLDAQSQIAISHYNQQMAAAVTGETIVEASDMPFRFEPASRSEAVGTVIILWPMASPPTTSPHRALTSRHKSATK